ncbi:MAG TPA: hypothetical protein VK171_07945 [Fimbriimonas sp.]|nr:hypothetical protein [Fimbriimonas sp.]
MGKKTWQEKLAGGKEPFVVTVDRKLGGVSIGDKMLVPSPRQVDDYIRTIPVGVGKTVADMRSELGKQNGADTTCPLCSGIFIRISAEAAQEELAAGKPASEVTPFWRVIPPKAPVRTKVSFPVWIIDDLRRAEGLPV